MQVYICMVLLSAITGVSAQAVILPEIPEPKPVVFNRKNEPAVPCDQILGRLEAYNDMARSHDTNVNSFLGVVTATIGEWHNLLLPLEGTTQALAVGTFAPIKSGAEKLGIVVKAAEENTIFLSDELNFLIDSLYLCDVTNKGNVSTKSLR